MSKKLTDEEVIEYSEKLDVGEWLHKKSGVTYMVHGVVINATNSRDNEVMVMYSNKDNQIKVFVREYSEFIERFEKIN